jgi:hypothetical protein
MPTLSRNASLFQPLQYVSATLLACQHCPSPLSPPWRRLCGEYAGFELFSKGHRALGRPLHVVGRILATARVARNLQLQDDIRGVENLTMSQPTMLVFGNKHRIPPPVEVQHPGILLSLSHSNFCTNLKKRAISDFGCPRCCIQEVTCSRHIGQRAPPPSASPSHLSSHMLMHASWYACLQPLSITTPLPCTSAVALLPAFSDP